MFERFTDSARRVVAHAQEEARDLGHGHVGTEHLLLGLVVERGGVAATALGARGVTAEAVRAEIESISGRGHSLSAGHMPVTERVEEVFQLGLREALGLGHDYIGTEHLLLGLIREGEGVAVQVLVNLGCDLDPIRQTVLDLVGGAEHEQREAVEDVQSVNDRLRGEVARLRRLLSQHGIQPDDD